MATAKHRGSGQQHVPAPNFAGGAAQPLVIASAGLCCSVGYQLAPACAAIRAGMDHFQQSHFKSDTGDSVLAAMLPEQRRWGTKRLALWLAAALHECLAADQAATEPERTAMVWLASDRPEQRAAGPSWDDLVRLTLGSWLPAVHPDSCVLPAGRAGLAAALAHATRLLERPDIDAVVLAGVDSLIDAPTISRLLQEERLLVARNSDGFVPGEAAAAVLLRRAADLDGASKQIAQVSIVGFAQDFEPGRVDGSVPNRAQGLTRAIRAALEAAGLSYDDLSFQCSDQNGEAFYAKEASHALARVAPVGGDQLQLVTLADSVGEVGAALGPLMLAYLSNAMPHRLGPGPRGLLHLAADDGRRAAVVLHLN